MQKTNYSTNILIKDLVSSIVVFLVAVPLCLGIAVACGLPASTGLISGIIGGVFISFFSGCSLLVSGPAAGLVAIVVGIVQKHGIEYLGLIVFAGGIVQLIFGFLKIGLWFRAVAPSVIHGMLSGIGIIIFASQFHVMLDDLPKKETMENILSIPQAVMKGVFPLDGSNHHIAAMIGIITITIIVLWNYLPEKIKIIPGAIVAVIVSTLITVKFSLPIKCVCISSNLLDGIHFLDFKKLPEIFDWQITVEILALAFIASAETLFSAVAIEQLSSKAKTDYNKEIIAQGIGNSIAGLLGVLPITAVIVRSAANVNAGAQTRVSPILHGVWIFLFVFFFPEILSKIPRACLAALLVYTGYKLVNLKIIKELLRFGKIQLIIYFATIITIVSTSLLEGILIGILISVGKLISDLTQIDIQVLESNNAINVHIQGNVSFITLPKLVSSLDQVPRKKEVHVNVDKISYIDHACIEFLDSWEKRYESEGGKVFNKWDELEKLVFRKSKNQTIQT